MLKSNWKEVKERYEAFWRGEPLDRPPVIFDTHHPMYRGVGYDYTKYNEDITRFCRDYREVWVRRADYPDDTVPCVAPQMGGAIEAAFLAGTIQWGSEMSVLVPHHPLVGCADLQAVQFDRTNPYFERVCRELAFLARSSLGDFGINFEASLSLTTTISQLRGGTQFMLDIVDCPDKVRHLAEVVTGALLAVQAEVDRLNILPDGTAHRWLNYWNPGRGFWFSEDDAVMISSEMYRDLFLDLDRRLCSATDIVVAHWHTAGLHLIPVLLEIPNLRMVQLSFDPNGPSLERVLSACCEIETAGRRICFQMSYDENLLRMVFKTLRPESCMFYFNCARDKADVVCILKFIEHMAREHKKKEWI